MNALNIPNAEIAALKQENERIKKVYLELLDAYISSMKNKCPENLLISGHLEWENKIRSLPART